jgi:hypothetical protein
LRRNNVFRQVFIGIGGEISSKRMMMFLSFSVMICMAIVSTFYQKKIEQFIFDGFLYIVVGSLFSVASERFSSAYTKVSKENYYEDNLEEKRSDK